MPILADMYPVCPECGSYQLVPVTNLTDEGLKKIYDCLECEWSGTPEQYVAEEKE